MDNIETTEPVGGEGATSSQDNSAIDTQPTESSDSVSDGQEAEVEKADATPWENDPRFKGKSPEEVYKSYRELESKLGERSEHSELTKMLEEQTGMSASQIRDYIARQREQQLQQQYAQNPTPYLASKISQLESQLALQAEEKELDKFLETNPDYAPFRDKIMQLGLGPEKDKPYEDIAREWFGEAIAKGQQTAYKKIETKKQTQATGAISTPEKKLTLEDMKNMSVAELRQILPHAPVR